ncbi:Ger(x)C family spore germination protein [Brevibacillus ginsengisoli]|uniref:Ger(x)C family spore germination protein n=1 Tax=Brevibacillus ginsengisoli TaxID=363854 RepID=UPI003CED2EA3
MRAKWLLIVLLLFNMAGLTGCWNRRELSDLAIVSAMAVDKSPKKNEYHVSFQIVNPGEVATGVSGGGGGRATPITVVSGNGTTLFEAIRRTSQKVPRQLFFAHIRLLVIGESLAKEGITELFDLFERAREARLTSEVLIARGTTANSLISVVTPMEKISANSTVGKLKFTTKVWSENIKVEIDDVIRALVGEGTEPVISGMRVLGDPKKGMSTDNVKKTQPDAIGEISGIAIFKKGKLKKWLDGDEARGYMWAANKLKSTILRLDCQDKKGGLGIEITRSQTVIKTAIQNGNPVITVSIREEGNVAEMKCATDLGKLEEIQKIEQAWSKETKKEVTTVVKIAQKEKVDIFGFGEAIGRQHPKEWETLKRGWNNTFSKLQVKVQVETYIRRPGMRIKPYLTDVKKKHN